jgi:hypothetical protein
MFLSYLNLTFSVSHFTFSFHRQGFYEFSHRGYGGGSMTKALSNHLVTKSLLKLLKLVQDCKKEEELHSSKVGREFDEEFVFVSLECNRGGEKHYV